MQGALHSEAKVGKYINQQPNNNLVSVNEHTLNNLSYEDSGIVKSTFVNSPHITESTNNDKEVSKFIKMHYWRMTGICGVGLQST